MDFIPEFEDSELIHKIKDDTKMDSFLKKTLRISLQSPCHLKNSMYKKAATILTIYK